MIGGLLQIAEQSERGQLVDMPTLMGGVMATLERVRADPRDVTGVASGLIELDEMTRGFQPGDLIVLAARPSMGKTALALNIARHAAGHGDAQSVAFFSIEMGQEQLGLRLVAGEAGIDATRLNRGFVSAGEWAPLSAAVSRIGETALFIDDSSDTTVFDIRAKARRLQQTRGALGLIVVDYLQLLRPTERGENRNLELAGMSRGLKILAKDLQCPVLVLSQLSRECEKRAEKRPMLSDLRDSGAIEQDADVVLLLYRDEVYNPTDGNRGVAEVHVAKQRNGPTGVVRLTWREQLMRFENYQRSGERLERAPYEP
jgi:replicative DNA helicase